MSEELFEVAFFGEINDGETPGEVRARVAKMFNADDAKLAQLFSGKRVVIKKNVDRQTAHKYQAALQRAGARCEVRSLAVPPAETPRAESLATSAPDAPPGTAPSPAAEINQASGEISPAPQTDPLGIKGDQIEDLGATIAPVGSELQSEIKDIPEPEFDLSEFAVAPVGSQIGVARKKPDPPPPDTSGITMADD